MDKQSRKFWQDTFQTSRYFWLGIVVSVIMLFWTPAFPYVYVGACGGFLHFVVDVTFYRQAYRQVLRAPVSFSGVIFIVSFLSPLARDLSAQPSNLLFHALVLQTVLLSMYFGIRALLFLIFKPTIVAHIGLKTD